MGALQILVAPLVLLALLILPLLLAAWLLVVRLRVAFCLCAGRRRKVLGLLHPYANDGGGGERVLWVALRELVERRRVLDWRVVVYTGDRATSEQIRAHAARQFGIVVPAQVEFVYLRTRFAVEPGLYPVATLLGQALGSLLLVAEAIFRAPPSVLLDTSGYGYSYALAKALGVPKIGCYVHYPMITSEMRARVASGVTAHNNKRTIGRSALLTKLKLFYYDGLMRAYCFSGRQADAVLANGSWTAAHLHKLWRSGDDGPSLGMSPCARTCDGQRAAISPPPPGAERQYTSLSSLARRRPASQPLPLMRAVSDVSSSAAAAAIATSVARLPVPPPPPRMRPVMRPPLLRATSASSVFSQSSSDSSEAVSKSLLHSMDPPREQGAFAGGRQVVTAYPPCDTSTLRMLPLAPRPVGLALILSIAQFRPEKDHDLQLRAFAKLLELQAQGPAAYAPTHACTPAVADSTDSLLGEVGSPCPAAASSLPSAPSPPSSPLLGHSSPYLRPRFNSESTVSAGRTTRRYSAPAYSTTASIAEEALVSEGGETSPQGAPAAASRASTLPESGPQCPGSRTPPAHGSPPSPEPPVRLVLVLAGAVRHAADAARLAALVDTARELGLNPATVDGPTLTAHLDSLPIAKPSPRAHRTGGPGFTPPPSQEGAASPQSRPRMPPDFPGFTDGYSSRNNDDRNSPRSRRHSICGSYLSVFEEETSRAVIRNARAADPPPRPEAVEAARGANVLFAPNLKRAHLLRLMGMAAVGLHTMWNEHFGIGVVELMAAGVPTVAHASGGPLLDIITPGAVVGLLAVSVDEYAHAMAELLLRPGASATRRRMAARARKHVEVHFSEDRFARVFCSAVKQLLGVGVFSPPDKKIKGA